MQLGAKLWLAPQVHQRNPSKLTFLDTWEEYDRKYHPLLIELSKKLSLLTPVWDDIKTEHHLDQRNGKCPLCLCFTLLQKNCECTITFWHLELSSIPSWQGTTLSRLFWFKEACKYLPIKNILNCCFFGETRWIHHLNPKLFWSAITSYWIGQWCMKAIASADPIQDFKVVCMSHRIFFEYDSEVASTIDWTTASVTEYFGMWGFHLNWECADGMEVALYWLNDSWQLCSSRSASADDIVLSLYKQKVKSMVFKALNSIRFQLRSCFGISGTATSIRYAATRSHYPLWK